jgi:hypothetical protein
MRRWPTALPAAAQHSHRTIVIPRAGGGGGKKPTQEYRCRECGARHIQWFGRCRECSKPGTLEQVTVRPAAEPASGGARTAARILQASHARGAGCRCCRC